MFHSRTSLGPVDLAFTDRFGGVSAVPYAELNLALEDGDDEAARTQNRRLVLEAFAPGDDLADLRQVHGCAVVTADPSARPQADGVVSTEVGLTLMIRVADCVPVLLADPDAGVVGAAHAGRPGLAAGVAPATVAQMRVRGATRITAWIGPHICGACYEVPAAVATTSWGTPSLDIGAGVRAQLEAEGVQVVDASACTRESSDLYSYRRDGAGAGRLAGLIRIGREGS